MLSSLNLRVPRAHELPPSTTITRCPKGRCRSSGQWATALIVLGVATLTKADPGLADDFTVEEGETVQGVTLGPGDTQNIGPGGRTIDITVSDQARQFVESDGDALRTVVLGGGRQYVGGTARDTFLRSGALQRVFSGGVATGTQVDAGAQMLVNANGESIDAVVRGTQEVAGFARGTIIENGGVQTLVGSDAAAIDTLIQAGGRQEIRGGIVIDTQVDGGEQIVSGGEVSGTILNAGRQHISGGTVAGTTINDGIQLVEGGTVSGTTLNGGTLQVGNGGTSGSIGGDITNNGALVFNRGGELTYGGVVCGTGTLTKTGDGLVTLTADHTYTGDTTIDDGTLQLGNGGTSGSIAGDVVNNGALVFNRGGELTYDGVITGSGSLTKTGDGLVTLTADHTYAGLTAIDDGTLAVDGSIISQVDVSGTGILAGVGTVGSLTAGDGGIVAPGSVLDPDEVTGVLTVDGDFVQHAGSIYQASVALDGASDLVGINGTAVIDGGAAIDLVRQDTGRFSIDTRYTLLTAAGGVNGAYGGLIGAWVADSPFIDFELAYDQQNVYLDVVRTDTSFRKVGETVNHHSVAVAVEAIRKQHPDVGQPVHDNHPLHIHSSILPLTTSEAKDAFDMLSGEIHASVHSTLIQNSHFIRDAAGDRIRAAFEGVGASSVPVMAYGPGGPDMVPATHDRFAVWARAFGAWGRLDGDGNAARVDHSTGGFIAGGDALVGEHWRLGLQAGYSRTSFDVDELASSGSSNDYHLGLYAGTQRGPIGFRSGLAYTWHRIETDRSVVFPGFSDRLSADYDAGTFQAFGELGYRLDTASVSFEPYANLAYVKFKADGFSSNGRAAALSGKDRSSDTTFTTLGLRASSEFMLGSMVATARGGIGWQHAFGDVTPETSLAFASGPSFTVRGAPIAENAAVIEAGLDMNLGKAATLGLTYQGQLASDVQEHGLNAKLSVRF